MYSFIFYPKRRTIHCTVTGERRYSADLTQGGLEVPCKLKFDGPNKALELCKSDLVSNTKYLYLLYFKILNPMYLYMYLKYTLA